jgi:Txe/YoeB family toxin of toxin-antitoxin system
VTSTLVYTKQALKLAKRLASGGLKSNAKTLLELIAQDPYYTPPPFEKLMGDLSGAYSRRINIRHQLDYQLLAVAQVIKVQMTTQKGFNT